MSHRIPFLTARWTNLALITYDIDPALLAPHIPPGCQLDTIDGRAFVSLVAFDFLDTRVLGVRWPGFVNFPEINLRYYVTCDGHRGVAFLRELVPSRLIARIARTVYNEPYLAVPMRSSVTSERGRIVLRHVAKFGGREQMIQMSAREDVFTPDETSREHFFKEHAWGYGSTRNGRLITYEVRHPCWRVHREPQIDQLDWDFGAAYGKKWEFLKSAPPTSLVFAEGSTVSVYPKGTTAIEKTAETIDLLNS